MMTWVVLAFTMEILSTVSSIDRVLQWGGDNWLLFPLLDEVLICAFWNAFRGCCSCPVEKESQVQGPQGHYHTWMPGNIAPWVGTCLDALCHWAGSIVK